MYSINDYEISLIEKDTYLFHETKAAKISNPVLLSILRHLKSSAKHEISADALDSLATQNNIDPTLLKTVLIEQLNVIKPLYDRKFACIYINSDDSLIAQFLCDSLDKQYKVHMVSEDFFEFTENAFVLFYRNNYTSPDFNAIYKSLAKKVYVVTAGAVGSLLVIDNIYFKGSGLPTHQSNLHHLFIYLKSGLESAKDNWLMFYRSLAKSEVKDFPNPKLNSCERGFSAYCLYKFISQFTDFWSTPLTTDQLNWFWHVDLKNFNVFKEVAVHSPFSEFDMNLNLDNLKKQAELVD